MGTETRTAEKEKRGAEKRDSPEKIHRETGWKKKTP
jgi:hypothetical protein